MGTEPRGLEPSCDCTESACGGSGGLEKAGVTRMLEFPAAPEGVVSLFREGKFGLSFSGKFFYQNGEYRGWGPEEG